MGLPRPVARTAGALAVVGAISSLIGPFLPWFHITIGRTGGVQNLTTNLDLYQVPLSSGARLSILIGAVGLALIGSVLVVFATSDRTLPIYWIFTAVAVASFAIAFGVAAVTPPHLNQLLVYWPTSRGPGAAVTLFGAGLGLASVLLVLRNRLKVIRISSQRSDVTRVSAE
jgi:hypothetical protein